MCTSYAVVQNGVNYSGWYLPSIEELNLFIRRKKQAWYNFDWFLL
jgi:hypothetical protein